MDINYEDDNFFWDMRKALFQELPEDVIVEVADLHGISPEPVFAQQQYSLLDDRPIDLNEIENDLVESINWRRVKTFLESGNSCCQNNCLNSFYKNDLMKFSYALDRCSKREAEVALLMNMLEHGGNINSTKRGKQRERQRAMYSVPPFGPMCREAFLCLWGKGERSLRNLRMYQKTHHGTFAPAVHGNANRSSHHALSPTIRVCPPQ